MSDFYIPKGYKSKLDSYATQTAIGFLKRTFENKISKSLNLKRVSAPLFVEPNTGLNDDLNGVERPVSFDIKATGTTAQVVHSLAKWKRMALYNYGFSAGDGIYTDMNAIRRDEDMDNLHSIYVDQWDWERVISASDRNYAFLKSVVRKIVKAVVATKKALKKEYPELTEELSDKVHFVTAEQLLETYPDKTPKERENIVAKKYRTVFVKNIGGVMKDGTRHDGRAPDYDDWTLNGDILFYSETLNRAVEISSMAIRVNAESLDKQLRLSDHDERRALLYHKMLLENKLPLTVGGGIGQSRLSMLLLEKAHIGEVQVSIWDDDTVKAAKKNGIVLL